MTQGPGPTREARIQRTRAWLRYSRRDLAGARDMARPGSQASPYQAAFWAQQAAEKALKGALTYIGVDFADTHRLNALAALLPEDWHTRRASNALAELTTYAVQTRYPDVGLPEPTAEDAQRHHPGGGGAAGDPARPGGPRLPLPVSGAAARLHLRADTGAGARRRPPRSLRSH